MLAGGVTVSSLSESGGEVLPSFAAAGCSNSTLLPYSGDDRQLVAATGCSDPVVRSDSLGGRLIAIVDSSELDSLLKQTRHMPLSYQLDLCKAVKMAWKKLQMAVTYQNRSGKTNLLSFAGFSADSGVALDAIATTSSPKVYINQLPVSDQIKDLIIIIIIIITYIYCMLFSLFIFSHT